LEENASRLEAPIRERILAAARDLFLREGFEGVSVRRIAERAGCSPGMLYHFFTSKELLLARLVQSTFEKLDERMARYESSGGNALRRLQQTLHAYVEFGFEHPHEYLFLFTHGHSQLAPNVRSVFETRGIACFRRIRVLCEEAMAQGLLGTRRSSPDEIAQALWASIHGLIHLLHSAEGFPFAARKRLARRQVAILIAGIRKA
jgi:AcrR family transcriptional regulator